MLLGRRNSHLKQQVSLEVKISYILYLVSLIFGFCYRMYVAYTKSQFDYRDDDENKKHTIIHDFVHIYTFDAMINCAERQRNHQETEHHEVMQVETFHSRFFIVFLSGVRDSRKISSKKIS